MTTTEKFGYFEDFIALSRYARYRDDLGRRETWPESVERLINWWCDQYPEHEKWFRETAQPAIEDKEVMPSMRSLMTAGKALDRCNVPSYNCAYTPIDDPRCFDEIMYILLCGTGVGFSVERQAVQKLPEISEEMYDTDTVIKVPDSKIGWASSFRELVSLLYAGKIPQWDTSKVRAAGERLKTFGGRASGPQPLIDLFTFTVELFKGAAGRQLSSLECHDLVCKIGDIVVSGGVRRSALLSLSNLSDDRMRMAKSGQWWIDNPQRALANNSACYTERPEFEIFLKEWSNLYESKSGERGVFNRKATKKQAERNGRRDPGHQFGTNPCSEIILRPRQFCNLTEVVVRPTDGFDDLRRKVQIAAVLGTFQSSLTDFRYLRKEWQRNAEEERLLGVSLTGIMDNPLLNNTEGDECCEVMGVLIDLQNEAIKSNKKWAKSLGVNQSAAITTVKPSGTVSQLCNTASGIHPRFSEYYLRAVRADKKDPLAQFMIDKGFPYETDFYGENNYVFYFPIKSPEGSITADDMTGVDQLDLWETYQEYWCEHKPSMTCYYDEDEFLAIGDWIWNNFNKVSGISFLPRAEHTYKQAPYQALTGAEYLEWVEKIPKRVDWTELESYEGSDYTTGSQEMACSAGQCEI